MENKRLDFLKQKVLQLPLLPGVYIMKDKSGNIIYIGKAKALKNRVSSYFRSIQKHTEKVYRMVMNVYDFDYIVTDSEFEALVLECSLIKRHTPKYNILLKDDKGYHYIRIEQGEFGKIQWVKLKQDDGAEYLGPYTSSYAVKQAVDETNKIFMLPTCSRKFPADIGKSRPCLNFYIKQCIAPCRGKISAKEYAEIFDDAVQFLKKGSHSTVSQLTDMMNEAAENLDFEKAARYRDRIRSIQKITEHQKVINSKLKEQDIIAIAQNGKKACMVLFQYRDGRLIDKKDFMIGEIESPCSARSAFLSRYYMNEPDIPRQIMIDGEYEDPELILQYIREQAGKKVYITIPQRGEQYKLIEMARTNAAETLSLGTTRTGKELSALDELSRLLGLKNPPTYIEAYDISNIGSAVIVAGMVVFENGRPLRSNYRKFNIQSLHQPDDYNAMRETISRRIARYLNDEDHDPAFSRLPDLILLDGGKGHVSSILPIIQQSGLSIPVFGMVKDDHHRTRAIAVDGGEIAINSHRRAFTLVSQIQDEVHRYTFAYSRSKHTKNSLESTLTQIEGIGPARAKALLKQFKTLKAIREADIEALQNTPSINKNAAEAVYNHFHGEDTASSSK